MLDAYAIARRPHAADVIRLAGRLTALATASVAVRPLRNSVMSLLGSIPAVQRRLARQLSGLNRRTEASPS